MKIFLGLLIWQIFIFLVSKSGFTVNIEFPPRFGILFIIPSFIFTAVFLFRNRNKEWITKISNRQITLFQSFRIAVELLFVWSCAEGILHENVTIEGYNFDMLFGFSALLVYVLVYLLKIGGQKLLLFWNYLGILVLLSVIFVFNSTLYFPHVYGLEQTPMTTSFLEYPYILVAGFMMPLAVFFHCLSILHIKKRNF